MTPDERLRRFKSAIQKFKKVDLFDTIYSDGTWEKIESSILSSTIDNEETINIIAQKIVEAVNWQYRIIFSLNTDTNKLTVLGYENERGEFVKDPNFKHPFSSLPGEFPVYNFLNSREK